MIDRLLDGLLPTKRQPAPVLETATDTRVVIDRGLAALIDLGLCVLFVEMPLFYAFSELFTPTYEALGGYLAHAFVGVLLPIYISYSFVLEWLYGRTPGKVNRKLLVVRADGSRCTLRASALRNLLRYVDLLGIPPLVLGLLVILWARGRRVGDLVAGTRVVRSTAPSTGDVVATGELDASAAERAGDVSTEE